jgi:hypothetical protein
MLPAEVVQADRSVLVRTSPSGRDMPANVSSGTLLIPAAARVDVRGRAPRLAMRLADAEVREIIRPRYRGGNVSFCGLEPGEYCLGPEQLVLLDPTNARCKRVSVPPGAHLELEWWGGEVRDWLAGRVILADGCAPPATVRVLAWRGRLPRITSEDWEHLGCLDGEGAFRVQAVEQPDEVLVLSRLASGDVAVIGRYPARAHELRVDAREVRLRFEGDFREAVVILEGLETSDGGTLAASVPCPESGELVLGVLPRAIRRVLIAQRGAGTVVNLDGGGRDAIAVRR